MGKETIYSLKLAEEALKKIREKRITLEKDFVKKYKDEFLLEYLLPLNNADFRVTELNIKIIKLLLEKKAINTETAISRKEIIATTEPLKKDIQKIFNSFRKFSPFALGIFGIKSQSNSKYYFIADIKKANQWLDIMQCFI